MGFAEFISTYTLECIIAVLALCLAWTNYWTRKTKRELNQLHGEVLAAQANLRSEIRDLRRRVSEDGGHDRPLPRPVNGQAFGNAEKRG